MFLIHKTKKTVFNYDDIPAGYYHEAMLTGRPAQRFWHREKFRRVSDRIRDGEKVLDLGCGPGSFLHVLAEEKPGIEAIGVDLASRQIDYARRFFAEKHPNSKVTFQVLDLSEPKLPFESGTFDVVTNIEVIEHIHPHIASQMLGEAKRVLKPNGRLIVTTPNYRSLWPLLEWVLEKLSPVKYHEQHINQFTPNSFVKFLEISGFEVVDLETIFIIAPFLAGTWQGLARNIERVENKALPRMGSLLIAESRKWDLG